MSEYQYYEFCNIDKPMTSQTRHEMKLLSSRSNITTHGASYVYNYGDFRGNPKELLLKYFDVYFYISNWGILQLMFKYKIADININEIKSYLIDSVITCEVIGEYVVLEVEINNENCGGWIDGEEMLGNLLPLYEEIKIKNYNLLQLVAIIDAAYNESNQNLDTIYNSLPPLSGAQRFLLKSIDFPVNI